MALSLSNETVRSGQIFRDGLVSEINATLAVGQNLSTLVENEQIPLCLGCHHGLVREGP